MSNFQQKLNLLDAAWQISVNTRREFDSLLQASSQKQSLALRNSRADLRKIEANLASLRELIQEEKP